MTLPAARLAELLRDLPDVPTAEEAAARLAAVAAAPALGSEAARLRLVAGPAADGVARPLAALIGEVAAGIEADVDAGRACGAQRLAALRAELDRRGLDGFLVPLADEHQGEYVPPGARRLAWLTGFTGSAGMAVVLRAEAALFVDGRYTLQAADQVDPTLYAIRHLVEEPPARWLDGRLHPAMRLAYDPWLHTRAGLAPLAAVCARAGAELVPVEPNPLDTVWAGRPAAPLAPVRPHPIDLAGEGSADKRSRIAATLRETGTDAAVLTMPDSIAWLLNIRGADIPHNPLVLAFAVLRSDPAGGVDLFVDPRKLDDGVRAHLGNGVAIRPPADLGSALDALGLTGARVRVDPSTAASWVSDRLEKAGAQLDPGADPCALPKACKNPVELAGTRAAHLRDGVALTRFLRWLEVEATGGGVDELSAVARLEAFRAQSPLFLDTSFDTISGAGPNGAIVHYRVTAATNRLLGPGELYLVDSGAQYADGTTDVTRTVVVGEPSAEQRDRFTRVLKGHVALSRARFPRGTTGGQLDVLARAPLWEVGLDYDHGTGHGVGSYLCVHEGPQRISKVAGAVALEPGMIVSNEPGYYKTGAWGIRIENLIVVQEGAPVPGGERTMLGFETLTLAPIDRRLIEVALLTPAERAWIDAYHRRVALRLAPLLEGDDRAWLEQVTAPLD